MKHASILSGVLLTAVLLTGLASAQQVYVVVHGGRSSLGPFYVVPMVAGGGHGAWDAGPLLGAGVRVKATPSFFIAGTVDFSSHPYHSSEVEGKPTNRILDLTALGRATFHIIGPVAGAFSFGLSYWTQTIDAVRWPGTPGVNTPALSFSGVGVPLGLGLTADLSDRLEVDLDGSFRFRRYTTSVVSLGMAYRVN